MQENIPKGCNSLCRACAHRNITSEESAEQKMAWLAHALSPWGKELRSIKTPLAQERWGYREKVSLLTQWSQEARWQIGMIACKHFVNLQTCPIHSERVRKMILWISESIPTPEIFSLSLYAQTGKQATLILKTNVKPDLCWLVEHEKYLSQTGIEGLWLHLHPSAGRRLFGKRNWHLLWGKPRSYNEMGLIYGPTAFQQLIPNLYIQSLREAQDFLTPQKNDSIIDLYCGSGASLRLWTIFGARTIGVEISAEAVENASINAPLAQILRGTCSLRIPQLNEWAKNTPLQHRLAYVNPPRVGLEPDVRHWLATEYRPLRLAYLSCNAGTLARDLAFFEGNGYFVEHITPYDFFPNTYHVETLTLLQRKGECPYFHLGLNKFHYGTCSSSLVIKKVCFSKTTLSV